ncbi:alpha/beta hydrolase fold domain-containing protein [Paraburkholderia azotifigens]|uniref:alpha/beta hydrolase n=1 Tax=Paraburkholderia azotifigens TaxID=2057004 RepID=UPI0031815B54
MSTRRFSLYRGTAPFALAGDRQRDVTVDVWFPAPARNNGYALIALAGRAYTFLSQKSGRDYGEWFSGLGFTVFVPTFRLGSEGYDLRAMCTDVLSTMRLARGVAGESGFRSDRIGFIGTSAGAHMAAALATGAGREMLVAQGVDQHVALDAAPDFCVLCYGVLTLMDPLGHDETRRNFLGWHHQDTDWRRAFSPVEAIGATTPRTFVWHTSEDVEVASEHSIRYAERLAVHGRPYEFHLYQKGTHALGLARAQGLNWADDCVRWILDRQS